MTIPWEAFSFIILSVMRGDIVKKSIYVIKNKINDKVYVGQAKDPQHRFISHLSRAKTNADNSPIHDAINKLGKENFYYEILEENIENYNEMEKYWIKKLNCKVPNGYNLTDGGEEPPIFYGEEHPNSVVTDEIVLQIINDLKQSKLT
jgi:group I intron endonuclease